MLEIVATPSGAPTARLDGRFLHSPRDPVQEARRAVEPVARREPPCVVILGFGLGYNAQQLLETTRLTHIIVFEPDDALAAEMRDARDVEKIVTSPRLTWCESELDLDHALAVHAASGFEVLSLKPRRLADPQAFGRADATLATYRSRLEINSNTVVRFGRLWVRNLCRNLDAFSEGTPVTLLENAFAGQPGLLLAAGPSLDQVLPHLAELAEHTVVVAVDTAVSVCRAHGVQPDIAVVVDPQYWNARHLDGVQPSDTLLVAESSTHPSVFRRFRTPPMFCSSLFPLGREVETAIGPMGSLGTGGSVSTTAWDLLRYAGCDPVYVAGLDLGFPAGRTHYRGSFFEVLAVALGSRLAPAERTIHRYLWSADPVPVDANDGGTVLTDRRMELYRRWFARKTSEDGAPRTFTLTRGGVRIEGIGPGETAEAIAGPRIRDEVRRVISGINAPQEPEIRARRSAIAERLGNLAESLGPLEELASRAVAAVAELERDSAEDRPVDFSPLETIDEAIRAQSGRAVVSFLMQQAIARITSGYGAASLTEQIDASAELYGELLDSVRFHLDALRDVRSGT